MGDGYSKGNTIYICTDCYTVEEVNLLCKSIYINFDIEAIPVKRIKSNGAICWRIKIPSDNIQKLRYIVKPYMISEMLYKLNIK